jgi:predicted AlkP superfamily pyrophosphatase or phosphodiesterase
MRRLLIPFLFVSVALGAIPSTTALAARPTAQTTAKYLCMIVLDGGKPEYVTNNLAHMPNMRNFLTTARVYDRSWVGSLMSITPPDHAVIGTGSLPKDDGGIVNWDWGIHSTEKISPTFQAVSSFQNGYAFSVMTKSGTPTLSGEIKKKYPGSTVIAGSGVHFHAAGPMGGPAASWIYWYNRTPSGQWAPLTLGHKPVPAKLLNDPTLRTKLPTTNNSTVPLTYDPLPLGQQDSLVVKFAIRSLQEDRPRAIMINLPEVDTIGHWSHHWKKDEAILYRSFDSDFGKLIAAYKAAGIYSQTMFVITSDHGMIQSTHRVLDRSLVRVALKSVHSSDILINGGGTGGPTMMSIWMKHQNQNKGAAMAIWNKHLDNVSAVYYMDHTGNSYQYKMAGCESETPPFYNTPCSPDLQKAYSYLFSTDAGPTGEDIGILLRENSRNSGLPQMMGRHGGADWGSQHTTMILSGPGVKAGTSHAPARLTDIAPTVERFMGITPNARDGVVLADAFQSPNPADVTAQTKVDAEFTPMVNALSQRATGDIKLEAQGKLPNEIPADEAPVVHWKRRLAVTAAGVVVLLGTIIGLAWAITEVKRQGTGLTFTS